MTSIIDTSSTMSSSRAVEGNNHYVDQSSSSQPLLPTSTHLITIPFPSPSRPTNLIAHLTLFRGNCILLWCGEAAASSPGREDEGQHHQPTAHLTTEWAVAMTTSRAMTTNTTHSTSLYRTNADYAQAMSARLGGCFKEEEGRKEDTIG